VRIVGYRAVTRKVQVWHTEMLPAKQRREVAGAFLPDHTETETRTYLVPEHEETRKRIVPGHYEDVTTTVPAHWGTREYWLEPHTEIRYRFVGTSEQRAGRAGWEVVDGEYVFVGTSEQRAGRAGWESYEVEIPGCWEERRVYFPETTRTMKTWIDEYAEHYKVTIPEETVTREEEVYYPAVLLPPHVVYDDVMVESTWREWEEQEFQEPIFGYADLPYTENLELVAHTRAPVMVIVGETEHDKLKIKVVATGEEFVIDADYVGCATRIGDNEFVIPEKYWPQVEEQL